MTRHLLEATTGHFLALPVTAATTTGQSVASARSTSNLWSRRMGSVEVQVEVVRTSAHWWRRKRAAPTALRPVVAARVPKAGGELRADGVAACWRCATDSGTYWLRLVVALVPEASKTGVSSPQGVEGAPCRKMELTWCQRVGSRDSRQGPVCSFWMPSCLRTAWKHYLKGFSAVKSLHHAEPQFGASCKGAVILANLTHSQWIDIYTLSSTHLSAGQTMCGAQVPGPPTGTSLSAVTCDASARSGLGRRWVGQARWALGWRPRGALETAETAAALSCARAPKLSFGTSVATMEETALASCAGAAGRGPTHLLCSAAMGAIPGPSTAFGREVYVIAATPAWTCRPCPPCSRSS